jgi:1-acyl-sn-glycerol-3-phosphate acyltransferase
MTRSSPAIAIRLSLIGAHLLFGAMLIALVFPFLTAERKNVLIRVWSRQLVRLLGIHINYNISAIATARQVDTHGLVVSNHISLIDIFVINAVMPCGFVSKAEVASWPLIGWMSRQTGTVYIERGNRRAAQRTREHMVSALAGGQRLAMFPEGTTSDGDHVLPFHGALLQSAVDAEAPVHALSLQYLSNDGRPSQAPAYIDDMTVLDCLLATLRTGSLSAHLTHVATFAAPHQDRRHLAHRAHQVIAAKLRNDRLTTPA